MSLLQIDIREARYGLHPVLTEIGIAAARGRIVAVIGPNGSGKSTLLRALVGEVPKVSGSVKLNGYEILGLKADRILASGIRMVPQGNRSFPELTVKENLELGGYLLPKNKARMAVERVLDTFSVLRQRLQQPAETLSGGERQQLALAQALVRLPTVLLLDEPSVGLAPPLASEVLAHLVEINREFRLTMLIVEQRVRDIIRIADEIVALKRGTVAWNGSPEDFERDGAFKNIFLD